VEADDDVPPGRRLPNVALKRLDTTVRGSARTRTGEFGSGWIDQSAEDGYSGVRPPCLLRWSEAADLAFVSDDGTIGVKHGGEAGRHHGDGIHHVGHAMPTRLYRAGGRFGHLQRSREIRLSVSVAQRASSHLPTSMRSDLHYLALEDKVRDTYSWAGG